MLRVESALLRVAYAAGAPRVRRELVPLAESLGRVLDEDVRLDRDAPPFRRSTMDGYAVRAADARAPGSTFIVVGRVHAGESPDRAVGAGEAVAIMTGAALPAGADAVVPVEQTQNLGEAPNVRSRVRLMPAVVAGQNVARQGEQIARGMVVASRGTKIGPGTVGVLAAAGCVAVPVAARPLLSIVCTGDEVVPADRGPGPFQIRDSNGHALAAQATRAGALCRYHGPVPDEDSALREAVRAGLEADVLCVSGGVSSGDRDMVPGVLESLGVERLFHKWAVKPGGPLWMGRRGETLVFGLPGNPAATFVGFELLVVPAIGTRLGIPFAPRASVRALLDGKLPEPISRRQFVPVDLALDGASLVARPVRSMGSGDLFALAAMDGLAVVHEEDPAAPRPEGASSSRDPAPISGSVTLVDVIPLGTTLRPQSAGGAPA